MLFEVLVPEMKKLVICVFAVKHTDVTKMSDNARNCQERSQKYFQKRAS